MRDQVIPLAPGRPIRRKVRWRYCARKNYLLLRRFEPRGRVMLGCGVCQHAHSTVPATPAVCPTLARELDRELDRIRKEL